MEHRLEVLPDKDAVAERGAEFVAATARETVSEYGVFRFAVSGGRTPWAMFDRLADRRMPWEACVIYQVDERVAPPGDPGRNLSSLLEHLDGAPVDVVAMPVGSGDLDAAAAEYSHLLPDVFDLVHLGLGRDGHTASLVPGDPVLDVTDRLVSPCSSIYEGRRRLTLTYPALARARQLMWLVTGQEKQVALRRLVAGDEGIPAGRVAAGASLILADAAAAGRSE